MSIATENRNTVEDFDREIARGFRSLTFSPAIEKLFLADYLANRARMVPLWALLGTLMYFAAMLGDFSMTPDVADAVAALRLLVFGPFAIAVVAIMRYRPTAATYDILALGVGLLGIALPMVTSVFSRSEHLFVYQTGSVGTLAFFVIVLRPRFFTVAAGVVMMIGIQLLTTRLNGTFDAVTYSGIVTFYVTFGIFLLLSAYFTEHVDRQNFLNRGRSDALHEELKKLSETDPMTGLANRHVLDRLRHTLWSLTLAGRTVSAIMLDIDSFKQFNDVNGHLAGDSCIRSVSRAVMNIVSREGTVFRYGGEEILVILPDIELPRALDLAHAVRQAIADLEMAHRETPEGIVTASLGVASVRTDEYSLEDLLLQTDTALYEAKRDGRNRVRAWSGRAARIKLVSS